MGAKRVPYMPCMLAWSTCSRANEPNACHLLIFTCQCADNRANLPKVCQLFNLACQRAKGVPIFQFRLPKGVLFFQLFFKRIFQFLKFLIILNIWKFRECLGNSRKPKSRNNEFNFWHFQNFIKEKARQPKSFDVVFDEHVGLTEQLFG